MRYRPSRDCGKPQHLAGLSGHMQDPAQQQLADGGWNPAALPDTRREQFLDEEGIAVRALEHSLNDVRIRRRFDNPGDLRRDVTLVEWAESQSVAHSAAALPNQKTPAGDHRAQGGRRER